MKLITVLDNIFFTPKIFSRLVSINPKPFQTLSALPISFVCAKHSPTVNSSSTKAEGGRSSSGTMLKYTQLSVTEERIRYSALKVLWHAGEKTRALNELSSFVKAFGYNQRSSGGLRKTLSGGLRNGSSGDLVSLGKIIEIASLSKGKEDEAQGLKGGITGLTAPGSGSA